VLATCCIACTTEPERLTREVADDTTCATFLRNTYSAMFTAHNLLWQDALEQVLSKDGTEESKDSVKKSEQQPLDAAKALKQWGDGLQFKELRKEADAALRKEIAHHAQGHTTMSAQERRQWQIEHLLNSPDWRAYLKQQYGEQSVHEKNQSFQATPGQLEEWTRRALA
jgi:hypothetical protein